MFPWDQLSLGLLETWCSFTFYAWVWWKVLSIFMKASPRSTGSLDIAFGLPKHNAHPCLCDITTAQYPYFLIRVIFRSVTLTLYICSKITVCTTSSVAKIWFSLSSVIGYCICLLSLQHCVYVLLAVTDIAKAAFPIPVAHKFYPCHVSNSPIAPLQQTRWSADHFTAAW